ncbi:MAG: YraN family protein [Candidatus Shapirobacteria bacterium]|jgi:putative endonuclease
MTGKQRNFIKGKKGELIAKEYLEQKGWKVIEINYQNKLGEIDLIMSAKDWLVIVEVKLKVTDKYGLPEEMIKKEKLTKVRKIAESYLMVKPDIRDKFKKYRIDGVCILTDDNFEVVSINHYENLY